MRETDLSQQSALRVAELAKQSAEMIKLLIVSADFSDALECIIQGRIYTSGMGKAALPARKLASTLCSNGIPANFIHAGEAMHGDLGAITRGDRLVVYSNSGKTVEVIQMVKKAMARDVKIILITGNIDSSLAGMADICLCYGELDEACPLGLTPTTSTTAMMIISDALAMAAQSKLGLTYETYADNHHFGYLGEIAHVRAKADKNKIT